METPQLTRARFTTTRRSCTLFGSDTSLAFASSRGRERGCWMIVVSFFCNSHISSRGTLRSDTGCTKMP